jgi:hypothetical protein
MALGPLKPHHHEPFVFGPVLSISTKTRRTWLDEPSTGVKRYPVAITLLERATPLKRLRSRPTRQMFRILLAISVTETGFGVNQTIQSTSLDRHGAMYDKGVGGGGGAATNFPLEGGGPLKSIAPFAPGHPLSKLGSSGSNQFNKSLFLRRSVERTPERGRTTGRTSAFQRLRMSTR